MKIELIVTPPWGKEKRPVESRLGGRNPITNPLSLCVLEGLHPFKRELGLKVTKEALN